MFRGFAWRVVLSLEPSKSIIAYPNRCFPSLKCHRGPMVLFVHPRALPFRKHPSGVNRPFRHDFAARFRKAIQPGFTT